MFQVNTILEIEPLEYNEQITDLTSSNNRPVEQSNIQPNIQSYSTLMYPEKSLWIQRDPNFSYPLANYMSLVTHPNPPENRVAVCSLCKSNLNRNYPPYLCPIPPEIDL
ncbi:10141_t:CDS:2, partial [Ambispora leptoticha]